MQHRSYPTRLGTPRPPAARPPALHLVHGLWVGSCPTVGTSSPAAATKPAERAGRRRRCPICRPERPDHHPQLAFLVDWITANDLDD